MKTSLTAFGLILLVVGASPLTAASLEAYLPLTEGLTWEFRQQFSTLEAPTPQAEARAVKKNLATTQFQGQKVHSQVFTFYPPGQGEKQETTSFIAADAQGYYVLARKTKNDSEVKPLPEKFYILKLPLEKGTSWKQKAEGAMLEQVIQETQAQVTVPAGTFRDCLLIKRLVFTSESDKTPAAEMLLWFAPGVGNVKVVTRLPGQKGELIQELVRFSNR